MKQGRNYQSAHRVTVGIKALYNHPRKIDITHRSLSSLKIIGLLILLVIFPKATKLEWMSFSMTKLFFKGKYKEKISFFGLAALTVNLLNTRHRKYINFVHKQNKRPSISFQKSYHKLKLKYSRRLRKIHSTIH